MAACWPKDASDVPDAPPQRLFVFTDVEDRITGIQWDRPGQSLIGPEELVLDFIVPFESHNDPMTPDPERILAGELLRDAVLAKEKAVIDAALATQLEAESVLDKDHLRGPLVAGIVACGLDHSIPPHLLATIRTPEDIGEYAFYFVGYVPDESFFPLCGGQWTRDEELNRARNGWYTGAIMFVFTFHDMNGISEPGFDRTVVHHDFVASRETRVRNLGGGRIRVEARVLHDGSPVIGDGGSPDDEASSDAE
jgi:hypothetical protein